MTPTRILIVGAGIAGKELAEGLRKSSVGQYIIVGFVDDDPKKIGKKLARVAVMGSTAQLPTLISKYSIGGIFIAIPSAAGETIRRIVALCQGQRLIFRIVPRTLEIVRGKVQLHQTRELRLEDLLGRAIVQEEQSLFANEFKGKTILVTGAAGSIGSELCRQIIQFSPKFLAAFDWWENGLFNLGIELTELGDKRSFACVVGSIQDQERLRGAVRSVKPDIVFHAAAFKHVPLMQANPIEAIKNNIFGTENVLKISLEENVKNFVYISTDKAVNPTSVMGTTKLVGEYIVSEYNSKGKTSCTAVRFGNVLDSHGSVFPLFRKQIANGGPVTVTDRRMTRYFMTIPEAVQLVLHASLQGRGGEIFMLDMGEQYKIDEFARFMIQLAGFIPDQDIKIEYVGRRPGEKLSEQLITESESLERTLHEAIYKVTQTERPKVSLQRTLADLRDAAEGDSTEKAVQVLKKFAPNLDINRF